MVKLISSDGVVIEVEDMAAIESVTIRNLMEDVYDDKPIILPNVDGKTLAKVVEWSKKQVDYKVRDENENENERKEWEKEFLDVDTDTLYHLIVAANYMNNPSLLNAVAEKVASLIRGKTVEQIRATFNIENDFTPEEEKKIQREKPLYFLR